MSNWYKHLTKVSWEQEEWKFDYEPSSLESRLHNLIYPHIYGLGDRVEKRIKEMPRETRDKLIGELAEIETLESDLDQKKKELMMNYFDYEMQRF